MKISASEPMMVQRRYCIYEVIILRSSSDLLPGC